MERRGIPATFFVNSAFVDNKDLFFRYKVGLIIESLHSGISKEDEQWLISLLKETEVFDDDLKQGLKQLKYIHTGLIDQIARRFEIDFNSWLTDNLPYASLDELKDLKSRGFSIGSHSHDHPRFKNISITAQKKQVKQSFEFLEKNDLLSQRYFSFPFGDESVSKSIFDWMYQEAECKLSFGVSGLKDDYLPTHLHRIPMDERKMDTKTFIKTEYSYFILKRIFGKNQIKRL